MKSVIELYESLMNSNEKLIIDDISNKIDLAVSQSKSYIIIKYDLTSLLEKYLKRLGYQLIPEHKWTGDVDESDNPKLVRIGTKISW